MANGQNSGDAQDRALRALVADGVISARQATAVAEALAAAGATGTRARWTEIVGFLGGGLVFAGAVALVASSWDDLTQPLRAGMLLVVAVLSGLGGLVAVGERLIRSGAVGDARRRIGGTLFVLAASTAGLALGVALEPDTVFGPFLLALLLAAAGYAAAPTVVGLLACGAFSAGTLWSAGELLDWDSMLVYGLATLALGVAWAVLALSNALPNRRLGLGIALALALFGAQAPLFDEGRAEIAYALTLAVAAVCLVGYRWERSWVLLVAGVVGVTLAVPEAIWDWTDGAIGGAAVLLVAGLVLLAASGLGILLYREGGTPAPADPPRE